MRHFQPPPGRAALGEDLLAALQAVEPLFEAAQLGVWFVDLARDSVWWSRLTRKIHEVGPRYRPTLGDAIAFYAPEARERVERVVEAARAGQASWDATFPLVTARGRHLLLRSWGLAVPGPDGAVRWLAGTCEDVTEATARSEEHARLALVVQQMKNAAVICDPAGHVVWANPAFERLTGRPLAQFLGRKPGHVLQGPGTDPATVAAIGAAVRAGRSFAGEILNYGPAGEPYWVDLAITPIRDGEGRVTGFVGIEQDVTARRAAQEEAARELEARRATETLLREIIDAVPVALSVYDGADRLVLTNRRFRETLPGIAAGQRPGMPLAQSIRLWYQTAAEERPPTEAALEREVARALEAVSAGIDGMETRLPDGRWLLSSVQRAPSGHLIWVRTDITALKRAELEARDLASRDPLTGLLNRAGFIARLKAMKQAAAAAPAPAGGCLLLIDVDHFKSVNDVYGHAAGDLLLKGIAARLRRAVRQDDLAARLGGDEFALFLPGLARAEAHARAEQLLRATERAVPVGGVRLVPSLSVGAALAGQDGSDCEELLRSADRALYEAKRQGRGRVVFYADRLATELAERRSLAERLRRALAAGRVHVALQPQLRLSDRVVDGFEALARWQDGEEFVPPPAFVAAAEEHGLAERLGRAVLAEALAACRRLRDASGRRIRIAVNVSTAQLLADDFPDQVLAALAHAGLPPDALELEITETVLLDRSFAHIERGLARLRTAGIRLALDDFGTGHASLRHLTQLSVDALKIDRSFVAAIGREQRRELIVRTILGLARGLALDCVAEGVETPGQLTFVEGLGASHVQGWLVGRPMTEADARALLAGSSREAQAARLRRRSRYVAGVRGG